MITHKNIASAVFQSVGAWACPNGGNCDCDCGECAERLVKEYEDAIRAEARNECAKEMMEAMKMSPFADDKATAVKKWINKQMKEGGENGGT